MPLQSRAAQGFAGAAVKIDLIHKGIKTSRYSPSSSLLQCSVKIDLIHKGIKTLARPPCPREPQFRENRPDS